MTDKTGDFFLGAEYARLFRQAVVSGYRGKVPVAVAAAMAAGLEATPFWRRAIKDLRADVKRQTNKAI